MGRMFSSRVLIGAFALGATATASLAWAQFGAANYGDVWLESSAAQRAALFDNYVGDLRLRAQPSSGDHPMIARYKVNQLACLDSGKVDFDAVNKVVGQYYAHPRFKCVTPEIVSSIAIESICRPYLSRDPGYMLPPLPAPCPSASPQE